MTLTRNAAECLKCGDTVESKYRHDWVSCSCGNIFVDGGLDYARGGADDYTNWVSLVEYTDDSWDVT